MSEPCSPRLRAPALALVAAETMLLLAWAAFGLDTVDLPPYPPLQAGLAVALSALVCFVPVGGGLPRAQLVKATALLCLLLWVVHRHWFAAVPPWQLRWVAALFVQARPAHGPSGWLALGAYLLCTGGCFRLGIGLPRRAVGWKEACDQFDRIVVWLFILLLGKALVAGRSDVSLSEALSARLIVPTYLLALSGVALARRREGALATPGLADGYRGLGIVTTFATVVLLCALAGAGLFALWQRDGLGATASVGPLATQVANALTWFTDLIGWLYSGIDLGTSASGDPDGEAAGSRAFAPPGHGARAAAFARWFVRSSAWAFVLAALAVVLWACYRPARAWWRATYPGTRLWARVWRWLVQVWVAFKHLLAAYRRFRSRHPAVRAYAGLVAWGHRSGLPLRVGETPLDYAERLKSHLACGRDHADTAACLDAIVAAVNLHAYGPHRCDARASAEARRALGRLRSPRLWPRRITSWLAGSSAWNPSRGG